MRVFSTNRAGEPIRANLHHVPWPLEEAEADIERNDLATAVGIDIARSETDAALLATAGGLRVAGGVGASRAGDEAGDGCGDADVKAAFSCQLSAFSY